MQKAIQWGKFYYFHALPWLGLLAMAFSAPAKNQLMLTAWGGWLTVVLYFYLVTERFRPETQPSQSLVRELGSLAGPAILLIHNLLLKDGSWRSFLIEDCIVEVSAIGLVLVVAALRKGWRTRGTAAFDGFWFSAITLAVLGGGSAWCFMAPLWACWWQINQHALLIHHIVFVGAFVYQVITDGLRFEETLSANDDSRIIAVLFGWILLANGAAIWAGH